MLGLAGVGVLLTIESLRLAVDVALGALGIDEPTFGDYAAYFAGFMLSSVVWAFVFAALVERVLGGAGARYARITYLACAVGFLGLALVSLRDLWLSSREVRADEARGRRAELLRLES